MADTPIPHFPVVHGNVYPDGSAHINFAGHDVPLTPANIDDARAQITSYAVAVARDVLRRPVRLTTVDPDGSWTLAAHPDGHITDLAPAPRPKRIRRDRAILTPPRPAPEATAQLTASAPSATQVGPAGTCVTDSPVWTPTDLPTEAEVTVFIERLQPAPAMPVLSVTFPAGNVAHITGTALVGRRPTNTTGTELDVHQIDDPSRNLSRTHFLAVWSGAVPAIIDQCSGNGTEIERGDAVLVATPGVALPLQDGDRLRFGDLRAEVALSVARTGVPE